MFDLHSHTTLSDGELSPEQLIEKFEKNSVELFSITDHNHSLVYENENYFKNLDIKYIKGTEIATSYNGVIIEILGYKVNHNVINEWYNDFFSKDNLISREVQLFEELKIISNSNGYSIDENLSMNNIVKGESKKTIYYYIAENLEKFEYKTYKEFFRKGLSNPTSKWFIDEGRFYPSIEEVINLIHKSGGIAILAHPYEYGFDDLEKLFIYLKGKNIDGIECFHPSCSMVNSIKLAQYCTENNLLGSGGSDFHRESRFIEVGARVHKDLFNFKCFDWIREIMK